MTREYQICSRCIMDTTDPDIKFDQNGVCNHCKSYEERAKQEIFSGDVGSNMLNLIVNEIKEKGKGKEYDCVIGVSGGVDSTFVAYKVKELGLRPLAVHLDNGWNSELAVSNIEKVLKKLGIELYTRVLDWEEFKDLQIAFLKASVPEGELPSDHPILPVLHEAASKVGVQYIILGSNISTEGIMPRSWVYGHRDWKYIWSIYKQFGNGHLKSYPHIDLYNLLYYKFVKRHQTISILNYLPYSKNEAIKILEKELGWQYYGDKHFESIYTRFFQGYILPRKFNIDKRKPHLSALICAGEITREQALEELKKDTYPAEKLKEDKEFVMVKLGLTKEEFENIMNLPVKTFWDYPSYHKHPLFKLAKALNQFNVR